MEMLELVLSWAVTTALVFAVVLLDERRLPEERLERAWPPASRNAALVVFGVLALPVHFAKTRGDFKSARGVVGVLLGLVIGSVMTLLVAFANEVVVGAIAYVIGLPRGD